MFKPFLKKLLKTLLIAAPLAILLAVVVTKFGGAHLLAHALENDIKVPISGETSKLVEAVADIERMLNYLLWPILAFIGALLQNDIFFGGGMGVRLQEIWINIRNVVNIFFVIILVGIALYNVLGIGEDSGSYAIKTILPKIIIGIIVINFSFLGAKVLLDSINVITTSIFALPTQISGSVEKGITSTDPGFKEFEESICDEKNGLYYFKFIPGAPENLNCDENGLTEPGQLFFSKYGQNNAAMLLAIKGGQIQYYNKIPSDVTDTNTLAISVFFSMLMYLVYAISFIALLVVLLGRVVILWLGIALSPVILLAMAVPDFKGKIGGLSELTDQFVKNAIAPILIALSLTVGWIMLGAFEGVGNLPGIQSTTRIPVQPLSNFQDLISAIAIVAIVWMGVFSAASNTVAKGVTDKIKGAAQGAGTFLATAPFKYWPILPTKLAQQLHMGDGTAGGALHALSTKAEELQRSVGQTPAGKDHSDKWGSTPPNQLGGDSVTPAGLMKAKKEQPNKLDELIKQVNDPNSKLNRGLKMNNDDTIFRAKVNELKNMSSQDFEKKGKQLSEEISNLAYKADQAITRADKSGNKAEEKAETGSDKKEPDKTTGATTEAASEIFKDQQKRKAYTDMLNKAAREGSKDVVKAVENMEKAMRNDKKIAKEGDKLDLKPEDFKKALKEDLGNADYEEFIASAKKDPQYKELDEDGVIDTMVRRINTGDESKKPTESTSAPANPSDPTTTKP
ncbi:MAG: hypothetical protein WC873_04355 [Candidatus Gracilibacteria bacterium]